MRSAGSGWRDDALGWGLTIIRVESDFRKPGPRQIHTIVWPDGRKAHYPDNRYRSEFLAGKLLGVLPGISLECRLDDGSETFDREYRELFP